MTAQAWAPTATGLEGGKPAEQLFGERMNRLFTAYALQKPDRIPVLMPAGHFLARLGGVTRQELTENPDKEIELLELAAREFQPDGLTGLVNHPGYALALGDRMTVWPGHGLDAEGGFQFVESEFMKPEDYDAFIEDTSDWSIRKYWPRAFSKLEGLAELPPLGMTAFGTYSWFNLGLALTSPRVNAAFQALAEAAREQLASDAKIREGVGRMQALGVPAIPIPPLAPIVEAPFDFMSDTLRGMRGIMLDILRRPDKLLAAQERVLKFQLEFVVDYTNVTGLKTVFIPLHRGSDGFMSIDQFERFYWPQLKALIVGLADRDILPLVFYEGVWDNRLGHLATLPRAKSLGWFQFSDIVKVKETVGDTMAIIGGMRNSILQAGTPEQVRAETRRVCEIAGEGGGFVMCPSIGEMEGCDPDLVKVWVDSTKEFAPH
jgi:uroporphyrinogen-III decarboxylase